MPIDATPDSITFAVLLTAAGTGIAAGIITTLVQLLKSVSTTIDAKVSGALLAFVLSAVLYLLAGIAVGVDSLDEGLVVFISWLTCATAAVGVYATVQHYRATSGS
jgi:uncharacterized protein with PQ loop repeat